MDFLLQHLINAVSLGGTYALLSLGLAIVFSIIGLINFAHGEMMTAAGYAIFFMLAAGVSLPLAILFAVVAVAVLAVAIERVAFRPMRKADMTGLLITSFAMSMILQALFQNVIGARPRAVAMPEALSGVLNFGEVHLGIIPMMSVVITGAALIALNLFLKHTVMGITMRAAAEDIDVVRLVGLKAGRVVATSFAVSGVLAAIAAFLWVAQRGSVDPLMGFVPVLKAFVATIVGGLGSLTGAVAGGMLLGIVEVLAQVLLPPDLVEFRDAFVLSFVILLLLVRPQGLLPAPSGRRS